MSALSWAIYDSFAQVCLQHLVDRKITSAEAGRDFVQRAREGVVLGEEDIKAFIALHNLPQRLFAAWQTKLRQNMRPSVDSYARWLSPTIREKFLNDFEHTASALRFIDQAPEFREFFEARAQLSFLSR